LSSPSPCTTNEYFLCYMKNKNSPFNNVLNIQKFLELKSEKKSSIKNFLVPFVCWMGYWMFFLGGGCIGCIWGTGGVQLVDYFKTYFFKFVTFENNFSKNVEKVRLCDSNPLKFNNLQTLPHLLDNIFTKYS